MLYKSWEWVKKIEKVPTGQIWSILSIKSIGILIIMNYDSLNKIESVILYEYTWINWSMYKQGRQALAIDYYINRRNDMVKIINVC